MIIKSLIVLTACAGTAPVQEMSNARQTLQVAKDARADVYARDKYIRARDYLDRATNHLNSGEFSEARWLAVQAASTAKQAHLDALGRHKIQ